MALQTVAVVGAGTMGSGIAQVCATSGYPVVMIDVSPDAIERAKKSIAQSVDKLLSKGQLTDEARHRALTQIQTNTNLSAAADADLVIEAASENEAVKKASEGAGK